MDGGLEFQIQRRVAEQRGIHDLEPWIDFQGKRRLIEHIALQVHARRYLSHRQTVGEQVDYAALGDISDFLSALLRHPAAEGDVLDRVDQFPAFAFLQDLDPAVADLEFGAGGEETGKDNVLRVGGDVDETAAARGQIGFGAELGDIDAAIAIDLQKRQQCDIEAATLEISELVG